MREKKLRLKFLKALSKNAKKTNNPQALMDANEIAKRLGCTSEEVKAAGFYLEKMGYIWVASQQGGVFGIEFDGLLYVEKNTLLKRLWAYVEKILGVLRALLSLVR